MPACIFNIGAIKVNNITGSGIFVVGDIISVGNESQTKNFTSGQPILWWEISLASETRARSRTSPAPSLL